VKLMPMLMAAATVTMILCRRTRRTQTEARRGYTSARDARIECSSGIGNFFTKLDEIARGGFAGGLHRE
jgi:hypothetical protein